MNDTAIIWTKDHCTFCTQAKALLEMNGISYEERNMSKDNWTREQLLEEVPNARTVPQIFINDNLIGGFTELQHYLQEAI